MKQFKVVVGMLLCSILILSVTACNRGKHPNFLTDKDWQHNTLACTEILHFHEDGTFSYYEACGNPVGNSDCYETYSYDSESETITAYGYDNSVEALELKVLRYTEDSLLLSIEGVIKEFYTYSDVQGLIGDMYDKVEGYSAYVAIGDIEDGMIETAPSNFDADAGGRALIRKEKLSETASFYRLYEEVVHPKGEQEDRITSDFTEVQREDVAHSEDNSFSAGFIWYNENLEITKIVYYGAMEIWE